MSIVLVLLGTLILIGAGMYVHGRLYKRKAEQTNPPSGKFAETSLGRIHYYEINPGAPGLPILFIHGASCHSLDMKTAFEQSDDRRKIFIDRPGTGYSNRPPDAHGLPVQALMIAETLAALDIPQAIVVAQSFGTAVALSMALEHPDKVAGLLLLAPVSHRWRGGVDWYNHAAVAPFWGNLFRNCVIPAYGRLTGRQVVESAFWPGTSPEDYFDRAGMSLVFRPDTFRANAEDIRSLHAQVGGMEHRYETLSMPLRMIAGTHDTVVLSTIHALPLEKKVRGASLRYVEGGGHPIHHQAQTEILEELRLLETEIEARRS